MKKNLKSSIIHLFYFILFIVITIIIINSVNYFYVQFEKWQTVNLSLNYYS